MDVSIKMVKQCTILACIFILAVAAILYQPIENTSNICGDIFEHTTMCYVCWIYKMILLAACTLTEAIECLCAMAWDSLYTLKCSIYKLMDLIDSKNICENECFKNKVKKSVTFTVILLLLIGKITKCDNDTVEEVDRVIEDEITAKLGEDLFESLEMKFQDDLAKSINAVLEKVKLLLQNGTNHIVDGMKNLQNELESIKEGNVDKTCMKRMHNKTHTIAESALHEMIICAYSLIGQDPSEAVLKVVQIKRMISENMMPIRKQKPHIYDLMRMCGHNHDSLKKVVKCVISKSPTIKSAMMETTQKIISGVTELTKLIAHGAMHEACLIEVIKSVELEAMETLTDLKSCDLKYRRSAKV